ncbi:MAG: hypothetical protein AVDCRST_MAG85-3592, partial [uncultured Solirubrobacteraceae bacterium]
GRSAYDAPCRGLSAHGHLAEGLRASGRSCRHRRSRERPHARRRRAQAQRVRLRACPAPVVPRSVGAARARPAARRLPRLRAGPRDARHARRLSALRDPDAERQRGGGRRGQAVHRPELEPREHGRRGHAAHGPRPRVLAHPLRARHVPHRAHDPAAADHVAPAAARRATAVRRPCCSARVGARDRAVVRSRRGARRARPDAGLPHAHADHRRGEGPRPRRLPQAGQRLQRRRQGRRPPPAPVDGARRHARPAGQAGPRGHGLGARRRLRPDRRGRLPQARRGGQPARADRRRRDVLRRPLPGDVQGRGGLDRQRRRAVLRLGAQGLRGGPRRPPRRGRHPGRV